MRQPADVARRIARLERFGFTAQQARALVDGGYDLMVVPGVAVSL